MIMIRERKKEEPGSAGPGGSPVRGEKGGSGEALPAPQAPRSGHDNPVKSFFPRLTTISEKRIRGEYSTFVTMSPVKKRCKLLWIRARPEILEQLAREGWESPAFIAIALPEGIRQERGVIVAEREEWDWLTALESRLKPFASVTGPEEGLLFLQIADDKEKEGETGREGAKG